MPIRPMTIQEQLARRMREKRKRLRLTQAELAYLVGTSQTAIARLENAIGNPSANLIQRVANELELEVTLYVRPMRELGITPDWLDSSA